MPRRVQDIVPGDRRSIRDITLDRNTSIEHESPRKTKKSTRAEAVIKETFSEEPEAPSPKHGREIPIRRVPITPPPPHVSKKKGKGKGWLLAGVIIIALVAGAAWAASTYFSRATFLIVPKKVPLSVNGTFIAQGTSGSALSYELVTLQGAASSTVESTNGPEVSTKAQGTVTLYNTNSQAQLLIAGTRISNDEGTIYRTKSSVTIPARGSSAPGTITTSIVADEAGEDGNITRTGSVSDMKIVAFKGTERYDTVYARPASDISGGFIGTKKIIDPKALASTSAMLAERLTRQLLDQARASIPEGHIMYDDVRVTTFSAPEVSGDDPTRAVVTVSGTLTGIFFNETQLVERLAGKEATAPFGEFAYTTPGLDNLDISIANTKDFSPQKKNSLILRIKGEAKITGVIPLEELRTKLAGHTLEEMQSVFAQYSSVIETGSGTVSPPWAHIPTDKERITIIIKEE